MQPPQEAPPCSPAMDEEMILSLMLWSKSIETAVEWSDMPIVYAKMLSDMGTSIPAKDMYLLIAFGMMAFERNDIERALLHINVQSETKISSPKKF